MPLSFHFLICKMIITVIIVAVKINEKVIKVVAEFQAQNRCLLNISYNMTSNSKQLAITTIIKININNKNLFLNYRYSIFIHLISTIFCLLAFQYYPKQHRCFKTILIFL